MQNPRLGRGGSLKVIDGGVMLPWAGVAARGQQRPAKPLGARGAGGVVQLHQGSALQPRAHLRVSSLERVYEATCPVGMGFPLVGGPQKSGCSHHRHSDGKRWGFDPSSAIGCITRVLPLGHSDPQVLFCRVKPTQACPAPRQCPLYHHSVCPQPCPLPLQLSDTLLLLASTSFQVLGHAELFPPQDFCE